MDQTCRLLYNLVVNQPDEQTPKSFGIIPPGLPQAVFQSDSAVIYTGFHEPIVFCLYLTTRKARKNWLKRELSTSFQKGNTLSLADLCEYLA
jgi:hypothetical protein